MPCPRLRGHGTHSFECREVLLTVINLPTQIADLAAHVAEQCLKVVLVGAIDVATQAVETPEQVAATLRDASRFVDPERMIACTNCGMAPMARGVSEAKLKALAAGATLFDTGGL